MRKDILHLRTKLDTAKISVPVKLACHLQTQIPVGDLENWKYLKMWTTSFKSFHTHQGKNSVGTDIGRIQDSVQG